jgi:Amt family ammonium transporter
MDALLRRCMGDRGFAERIIVKFKTRMVDDLEQLDASIRSGDALATARLAHSLKGATATLSAEGLHTIFARLETIGRSGDVAEAPQCLAELKEEWLRFLEYIQGADVACTRPG